MFKKIDIQPKKLVALESLYECDLDFSLENEILEEFKQKEIV